MGMNTFAQCAVLLGVMAGLAGSIISISWIRDCRRLSAIAQSVARDAGRDSERILALTEWVYGNQGFQKNKRYYLIPSFGPTPIDVLEHGGDCADKSRLLSAMLRQLKISSTLAMLYSSPEGQAVHTVVEAKYERGWMVIDPVYNLWFPRNPKEARGEYHFGLKTLIANPGLLEKRLEYLRKRRGKTDKINFYDEKTTIYSHARTINWRKNGAFRILGKIIESLGGNPYLIRRPYVMEDPKLAMALFSGSITIGGILVYALYGIVCGNSL